MGGGGIPSLFYDPNALMKSIISKIDSWSLGGQYEISNYYIKTYEIPNCYIRVQVKLKFAINLHLISIKNVLIWH